MTQAVGSLDPRQMNGKIELRRDSWSSNTWGKQKMKPKANMNRAMDLVMFLLGATFLALIARAFYVIRFG